MKKKTQTLNKIVSKKHVKKKNHINPNTNPKQDCMEENTNPNSRLYGRKHINRNHKP